MVSWMRLPPKEFRLLGRLNWGCQFMLKFAYRSMEVGIANELEGGWRGICYLYDTNLTLDFELDIRIIGCRRHGVVRGSGYARK